MCIRDSPCGIGSGEDILEAYIKAYECDSISIFGGIVAANREINLEIARKINEIFIEVLMAPSFSEDALKLLTSKKNIRLIEIEDILFNNYSELDIKKVTGGLLLQEKDTTLLLDDMEIVTNTSPNEKEMEDLLFAWKAAKNIKSNGVIIAKDKATIGIDVYKRQV